ncbi:hypothetical protein DUNSADRAFT_11502 [Dunaliella salina]|uniref:Encoded protein n=1 Tax=Dunaliella salina TaxID=3046 RepID=A0ABQ7GD93_DUNSA|nr:hypothetical protein DUNSADRAFT_11502 [Dunaliella salina]|eukprot:KAF5832572.1 hypothetical protein DUNSADRAFT_11502 [Dunaliella salina]
MHNRLPKHTHLHIVHKSSNAVITTSTPWNKEASNVQRNIWTRPRSLTGRGRTKKVPSVLPIPTTAEAECRHRVL